MKNKLIKWLCKTFDLVEKSKYDRQWKIITRMLDLSDAYQKKSPDPAKREVGRDMYRWIISQFD